MEAANLAQEKYPSAPADQQSQNMEDTQQGTETGKVESQEAVAEAQKPKTIFAAAKKEIPKDFASRVATKINAINERELDEEIASAKVSALIYKNMNSPDMFPYFNETIEILLQDEHTQKYAATTWTSLLWHEDVHPEYRQCVENILLSFIHGHITSSLPPYEYEETGKEFSVYAYTIGESFIQMIKLNSDLYNILTDIFGFIIRSEMSQELERKEQAGKKKGFTSKRKTSEPVVSNPKKLFDDIVDYTSERGELRSDTLDQKNPNEFILILADQMRATRRYIIQDIMNRFALEKKKVLEKELKERQASAEEVITASNPFKQGLYLFWLEKRYNFKYLAVEKVRITLQILAIFVGLGAVGTGFLGLGLIGLLEGIFVCALMFVYAQLFCSRFVFAPFYPKDVTVELEKNVGAFTPTFRKMSLEQINAFLSRQLRDEDNSLLLHLVPEYVKYIFAVMPDRTDILLTKDDINEFMERLEINMGKIQRGK